jgi:hypothetical protein
MRLDHAVGIDGEEQLGRARQDDRLTKRHQRAVFHRLALDQRVESSKRIARPAGTHREGEVRLVAVALAQMPVQARETPFIILERPLGPGVEDRAVARRPARHRTVVLGRAVEDAEANERRAPALGQQRSKFRLEQVAGLIGEIAGKPFAGFARCFGRVERGKIFFGGMRGDDVARHVEAQLAAGEIVAKKHERHLRGRHVRQSFGTAAACVSPVPPARRLAR